MKNYVVLIVGILASIAFVSCEKDAPEYIECELEHLSPISEWGEKVREELISLFFDIEDLALVRVYNTTGDITHWSGFDAGDPSEDSRQIQVDLLETELILIWKRFVEGKWTHSVIRVNYDDINTTVLQNISFIKGGQVVRRANNVLIFASDSYQPLKVDGRIANAIPPEQYKENSSREVFSR
jgi:hypothetical protein